VEDIVRTDTAAIADELKKRGCSEKAIEKILSWYGFTKEKTTQSDQLNKKNNNARVYF